MFRNLKEYLSELRQELAGSDPATTQDALSDAEEHLTAALAGSTRSDPELSEADRLSRVIDEYGSPKEIATAYRIIERRMQPALVAPRQSYEGSSASRFFSVVYDPRAWGTLLYLVTSMLTGIIYFTWAIVGLSLSLELLILIIGLPVAWLFLRSVRGIALVEGRIIEGLLGVRMPRRPLFSQPRPGWWAQFNSLVRDRRTWLTIAYMLLQLPLGIFYFSVTIIIFALSLELVVAPIVQYVFHLPVMVLDDRYIYFAGHLMPLVVCVGLLLFILLMHMTRGLGFWHAKLARAMLVGK